MANKSPRRPARKAAAAPSRDQTRTLLMIAGLVTVVVVIGLVVALVVGGGDDDSDTVARLSTTPMGVAICPDATTVSSSNGGATAPSLPSFPTDDIFKPVGVDDDVLPSFTREIQEGAQADTALCQQAPIVSGYDYAGTRITIDPQKNGLTMVVLLAHWCPHCNAEIPVLNEWRDSGDVPDELNVVGVSTGVDASAPNYPPDEWLEEMDWQWPVLADDRQPDAGTPPPAMGAYGGTSYPTMVIIGSDGRVLARVSGELGADEVDQMVDEALAQDA